MLSLAVFSPAAFLDYPDKGQGAAQIEIVRISSERRGCQFGSRNGQLSYRYVLTTWVTDNSA